MTIKILHLTFAQGKYSFSDKRTVLGKNIKSRFKKIELHGECIYLIRKYPLLKHVLSCTDKYEAKKKFDILTDFTKQK